MLSCKARSALRQAFPSPVRLSMLLTGCLVQARLVCSRDRAWNEIRIPADMGMDCGHYKWYQNQSIVELAFPVPEHVQPKEVQSSLMQC